MARSRVSIGKFRLRATIYRSPETPTLDAGGNPSNTPNEVFIIRSCRLVTRFGSEQDPTGTQTHEIGQTTIEMRSDPETRQIIPSMEIDVAGTRYEITAAPDRNKIENKILRIKCTEVN